MPAQKLRLSLGLAVSISLLGERAHSVNPFSSDLCSLLHYPSCQPDQSVSKHLLNPHSVPSINLRIKSHTLLQGPMGLNSDYSDLTHINPDRLASTTFQLRVFAHVVPSSLPVPGWLFFSLKFLPYRCLTSSERPSPTTSAKCSSSFPSFIYIQPQCLFMFATCSSSVMSIKM